MPAGSKGLPTPQYAAPKTRQSRLSDPRVLRKAPFQLCCGRLESSKTRSETYIRQCASAANARGALQTALRKLAAIASTPRRSREVVRRSLMVFRQAEPRSHSESVLFSSSGVLADDVPEAVAWVCPFRRPYRCCGSISHNYQHRAKGRTIRPMCTCEGRIGYDIHMGKEHAVQFVNIDPDTLEIAFSDQRHSPMAIPVGCSDSERMPPMWEAVYYRHMYRERSLRQQELPPTDRTAASLASPPAWLVAIAGVMWDGVIQGAAWDAVKWAVGRAISKLQASPLAPQASDSKEITSSVQAGWREYSTSQKKTIRVVSVDQAFGKATSRPARARLCEGRE